jgi:hypothetical protein
MGYKSVDLIHLAQDAVRWRGVVNTVMNLRLPWKGVGNSLPVELHTFPPYFFEIHFNIILPSMPRYFDWLFLSGSL